MTPKTKPSATPALDMLKDERMVFKKQNEQLQLFVEAIRELANQNQTLSDRITQLENKPSIWSKLCEYTNESPAPQEDIGCTIMYCSQCNKPQDRNAPTGSRYACNGTCAAKNSGEKQ